MNQFKTLHEICRELGITRKVIQGYEKRELIKAYGKNAYGHLIYDLESEKMIKRIRFFQELGFTLSEIKQILNENDNDLIYFLNKKEDEFDRKIKMFKEKKKTIGNLSEFLIKNRKSDVMDYINTIKD